MKFDSPSSFDEKALRLYAVTDRSWLGRRTLVQVVEEALKGGATMVQLREKSCTNEEFLAQAKLLLPLCRQWGVPLIINDNVAVAKACGANGAHVGQGDVDMLTARRQLGPKAIVGVSVQTVAQAVQAEKNGADYLGVGAVFATSTKADADSVSYRQLKEICAAVKIPVCAIGGIYSHNMGELAGAGIRGVALISAIFAAPDIAARCAQLLALSKEMVGA